MLRVLPTNIGKQEEKNVEQRNKEQKKEKVGEE
jgi:hypothetical protein